MLYLQRIARKDQGVGRDGAIQIFGGWKSGEKVEEFFARTWEGN
jgi:hypothetical protein